MKVLLIRTKMIGGGNRYEARIPLDEHPCKKGMSYIYNYGMPGALVAVPFDQVFITQEHLDRPVGYERYEAFKKLEAAAHKLEDEILRANFPELACMEKSRLSLGIFFGLNRRNKKILTEIQVPPVEDYL